MAIQKAGIKGSAMATKSDKNNDLKLNKTTKKRVCDNSYY